MGWDGGDHGSYEISTDVPARYMRCAASGSSRWSTALSINLNALVTQPDRLRGAHGQDGVSTAQWAGHVKPIYKVRDMKRAEAFMKVFEKVRSGKIPSAQKFGDGFNCEWCQDVHE